jgi:triacylglycerol lipase
MAHSMGGLDGRHLITHIRPTEYVPLSLTSISTPHRGSPFMDWCAVSLIPFMFARKDTDEINTTSNISVSDADNPVPPIDAPTTKHNRSRNRYRQQSPTARPRSAKRLSVYRCPPSLPRLLLSSFRSSTHPHTQT